MVSIRLCKKYCIHFWVRYKIRYGNLGECFEKRAGQPLPPPTMHLPLPGLHLSLDRRNFARIFFWAIFPAWIKYHYEYWMIFFADILRDLGVVLQTVANNSSSLVRRSSRHVDSYLKKFIMLITSYIMGINFLQSWVRNRKNELIVKPHNLFDG